MSPIVLATYREFAETLRQNGVATPQPKQDAEPLYYDLDLTNFLDLFHQQKKWNQLGIHAFGIDNSNLALAQTSYVCGSNSGASYLGMVAFRTHGEVVKTRQKAMDIAVEIRSLWAAMGLPLTAPMENYFTPEGPSIAPIVVGYEHQFLAHQVQFTEQSGRPDHDRVLLYPDTVLQTEPELIALTDDGDLLGDVLINDPQLRRRALELGF